MLPNGDRDAMHAVRSALTHNCARHHTRMVLHCDGVMACPRRPHGGDAAGATVLAATGHTYMLCCGIHGTPTHTGERRLGAAMQVPAKAARRPAVSTCVWQSGIKTDTTQAPQAVNYLMLLFEQSLTNTCCIFSSFAVPDIHHHTFLWLGCVGIHSIFRSFKNSSSC